MWILWLSTGANATHASRRNFVGGGCSFFTTFGNKTCNEFRVVEAFSYIIFIILFFYSIALFVLAITHSDDGTSWGRRRDAATRGGPETGQVKPAQVNQGATT
ncbi:hypothetical protein K503DRAFT_773513 [Rhizopogon vinicolor AM-OR11-026]|uniref:MARVEL domain-containing protein n=1 Tax=Rhizopogon vinicolor AM-OR11-026 TaxID=1314800 RepID=A0A1B7MS67_9AGAM|nr:hypothetical protein K503DRAFT_773513 [Rhizopogon vinicolor AM-OR11-026]